MQIWEDHQESKTEKQLISYRSDIRNTFSEAANVIDLRFDEETQTWLADTLNPKIADIDNQIKGIKDDQTIKDKEFTIYSEMLIRTRNLIAEVQREV